jgi:hypothetical protein
MPKHVLYTCGAPRTQDPVASRLAERPSLKARAQPNCAVSSARVTCKQTDRDGNLVIGDKGKPIYKNFIDFKDRATRDRFTAQVVDLIGRDHPDIVADEAVS